jgi:hypothetical protein
MGFTVVDVRRMPNGNNSQKSQQSSSAFTNLIWSRQTVCARVLALAPEFRPSMRGGWRHYLGRRGFVRNFQLNEGTAFAKNSKMLAK